MRTNATTPRTGKMFKTAYEKKVTTRNIVLKGVEILQLDRLITKFKVVKEVHPKSNRKDKVLYREKIYTKVETLTLSLTEVTPEALGECRKNGVSSFVLKVDGKLYYTAIPCDISFLSSNILGEHRCGASGHECYRLSPASDENGGCEKIRNNSSYIERYPWITLGYETFNTSHDSFVVVNCLHYKECPPREPRSVEEIYNARLSLAQFVWDDVNNLAQVRARKERNRENFGID